MTTEVRTSIADIAALAFSEYTAESESQGDQLFDQHREEFLTCARVTSRNRLGVEAAEQLDWQYTGTMHLPPDTEEATARIDGGPLYLRYRYSDEEATFTLVQPCGTCGHEQIDAVTSLVVLGGLLEAASWKEDEAAVTA